MSQNGLYSPAIGQMISNQWMAWGILFSDGGIKGVNSLHLKLGDIETTGCFAGKRWFIRLRGSKQ